MKYDIAKNEDGPLRRTMKKKVEEEKADEAESPALSERIANGRDSSRGTLRYVSHCL